MHLGSINRIDTTRDRHRQEQDVRDAEINVTDTAKNGAVKHKTNDRGTSVLKRITLLLISFPVALLLITLAIANRHTVRMVLDPFNLQAPVISIDLPFFYYLFGALLIGVVAGGSAVWLNQSHWRHTARHRTQEARRWHSEADRLTRERDADVDRSRQLAIAGR